MGYFYLRFQKAVFGNWNFENKASINLITCQILYLCKNVSFQKIVDCFFLSDNGRLGSVCEFVDTIACYWTWIKILDINNIGIILATLYYLSNKQ